jgi:hypothetical protein
MDSIARLVHADWIAVSLAVMHPHTWLRYHEGFWGYAEYISRSMLGVFGPDEGCAVHVTGSIPQPVVPGKIVTFDDSQMHEAYNISDEMRICLIFDLHCASDGGFRRGRNGLTDIANAVHSRDEQYVDDRKRKEVSLKTIDTIANMINV